MSTANDDVLLELFQAAHRLMVRSAYTSRDDVHPLTTRKTTFKSSSTLYLATVCDRDVRRQERAACLMEQHYLVVQYCKELF